MIEYKVDLKHRNREIGVPVFYTEAQHNSLDNPRLEAATEAQSVYAEAISRGNVDLYNEIMLSTELIQVSLVSTVSAVTFKGPNYV